MAQRIIRNLIPKIRKELSIRLNIIEKNNIKKITGKPTNIKGLLKELRENIESENHWATFYLTQIISERITDFIIVREQNFFKNMNPTFYKGKFFTIKDKINSNYFTFGIKIDFLKELMTNGPYTSKDFKTLIDILNLLCFIRNRYMFHVTNLDEYSFIYGKKEKYKKDEQFIKNLEKLIKNMTGLMNNFHRNSYEWHLLERYSSSFKRSIEHYRKSIEACIKKDGRRTIDNTGVYAELPKTFSVISYVFILFFGRKNMNLLS